MSTSGSFTFSPANGFVNMDGQTAVIPAATGAAQTVTPTAAMNGFTAFNYSNQWIKGIAAFTGNSPAATGNKAFLVPPGGSFNLDFQMDSPTSPLLTSIVITAVAAPAATGSTSALVALASFTGADAIVQFNFANQ